ncbi:MAG: hypothetical protein WD845_09035 [Pirellulales bacterium]
MFAILKRSTQMPVARRELGVLQSPDRPAMFDDELLAEMAAHVLLCRLMIPYGDPSAQREAFDVVPADRLTEASP